MSIQAVEQSLREFLESRRPAVLALAGEWGSGKTYFWNRFVTDWAKNAAAAPEPSQWFSREKSNRKQPHVKGYTYVSLFGLNSLADFRRQIALNARLLSDLGPSASGEQSVTMIDRALSSTAKARIANRLMPLAQVFEKYGNFAPLLDSAIQSEVSGLLVVIDDLERRGDGLSLRDALGYCTHLRDTKHCRVLVILNDGQLRGEDAQIFAELNEKVVDRSIRFEPDEGESIDIAFAANDGRYELVKEQCRKVPGFRNIRVMMRIRALVDAFAPELSGLNAAVNDRFAQLAVLLSIAHFAPNAVIPTLAELKVYRDPVMARLLGKADYTEEEQRRATFLSEYGFRKIDEVGELIVRFLEKGIVDAAQKEEVLAQQSAIADRIAVEEEWLKAFDGIYVSFDADEAQVLERLTAAFVPNAGWIDASFIDTLAPLFRDLGRPELATHFINTWVERKAKVDPEALDAPARGTERQLRDAELLKAMADALPGARPRPSFDDAVARVVGRSSWDEADIAVLSEATPERYEQMFRSLRGGQLKDTVRELVRLARPVGGEGFDAKVKQALRQIAADGPLNKWRMRRWVNLD